MAASARDSKGDRPVMAAELGDGFMGGGGVRDGRVVVIRWLAVVGVRVGDTEASAASVLRGDSVCGTGVKRPGMVGTVRVSGWGGEKHPKLSGLESGKVSAIEQLRKYGQEKLPAVLSNSGAHPTLTNSQKLMHGRNVSWLLGSQNWK